MHLLLSYVNMAVHVKIYDRQVLRDVIVGSRKLAIAHITRQETQTYSMIYNFLTLFFFIFYVTLKITFLTSCQVKQDDRKLDNRLYNINEKK